LIAAQVSVMQATPSAAVRTAALTAVYIGVMLTIGRVVAAAAVARLDRSAQVGEHGVAVALVAVLLSAVATEFIGIHAIFGAFLMGTIIPHDSRVSARVTERLADIVRAMLLPAFFAFTGMRTEIGLIQTAEDWLICAAIVAVATAGKFGGTAAAARLSGEPARGAAALGALMNTRGLVELIVLNIGLDLGVITPRLFAMLVIMALVTTLMTSPLVDALVVRTPPGRRILR
jgi:Kef-type K+ transport system membrane component KefB